VEEDCGPCTQLMVTMALHDGLAGKTIAAILEGGDSSSEGARLGIQFARAVRAHAPSADALREELVARWGPRALPSLAFAIGASRVFPTLKYALGYGKACQRVIVAGQTVTPRQLMSA